MTREYLWITALQILLCAGTRMKTLTFTMRIVLRVCALSLAQNQYHVKLQELELQSN